MLRLLRRRLPDPLVWLTVTVWLTACAWAWMDLAQYGTWRLARYLVVALYRGEYTP